MKKIFLASILGLLVAALSVPPSFGVVIQRKATREDLHCGNPALTVNDNGHIGHYIVCSTDNTYSLSAPYVDARTGGTIQVAIDNAYANGVYEVLIPAGVYSLTSTLNVHSKKGMRVHGVSGNGTTTNVVTLQWDGANGGTVLSVIDSRDCIFQNFDIKAGSGTIGVGIDLDFTAGHVPLNTNNVFEFVTVGASTTGIRLSYTSTSNNELHTFREVTIYEAGTYGYQILNSDSKFNKIIGGSIGQRTYGIYVDRGSFTSHYTNFSLNTTDIYILHPTDAISIYSPQSEHAEKFLNVPNWEAAAFPVTIMGGRLNGDVGTDNEYISFYKRGPLNLIGNEFAAGLVDNSWRIRVEGSIPGSTLNAIGNSFPNATPYDIAAGGAFTLNSIGNVYMVATNDAQPLPTVLGPQNYWSTAKTNVTGISGISGDNTTASNLRGTATFDNSATVSVTFGTEEYNQIYYVGISGNTSETFFVTSKTSSGFTINSSNATSTAVVDWIMVR